MSTPLYGVMAEFLTPEELITAAREAERAGYRKMEGYTPFPVEGLAEALGQKKSRLPFIVLASGLLGAASGYGLQYFTTVIDYPINIAGKPLNSLPAFIPITFELTILFASLSAAIGMMFLNGLPNPYHPVFHVDEFARASRDRFFLCIEAEDPLFNSEDTTAFLNSLKPVGVHDVEP